MIIFRNILGIILGLITIVVSTLLSAFLFDLIISIPFAIGIRYYFALHDDIRHAFVAMLGCFPGLALCSFISKENINGIKIGVIILGILMVLWAILDIISSIKYSVFSFDFLWGKIIFAQFGVSAIYFEIRK